MSEYPGARKFMGFNTEVTQGILFYLIGVLNILTDLALVVLPTCIMWRVQLPSTTRLLIVGVFASRLL